MVETKKQGNGCLKVFLIVIGVVLTICVIGGFVVYQKAGDWTRGMSAQLVVTLGEDLVKESDFSPEEQERILLPLRSLATKIEAGEVSMMQGLAVMEAMKDTALPHFVLRIVEIAHLQSAQFSEQEVREAKNSIDRLRYGLSQGSISMEEISSAMQPVVNQGGDEGDSYMDVKENPSAQAIRTFIERSNALLAQKNIAEEVPEIDFAKELQKAIASGLEAEQ